MCAYKGEASYWSATAGGEIHEDIAWSYHIYVEGERLERPTTQWSGGLCSNVQGGSGSEQGPHGTE